MTQTDEKRRVFDGLDIIQERNSNNEVTAQLVRDGNIGGILSRTTATGAAFYGYDGNGNVTLLTDSAGQDVGHYRYDAFGNTLEATGPRAGENLYRFSTKELHGPSGLYDYGFRFYSPGLGRWMNRDPIREKGGVNLYGAMGNNPVNNVDDYGLIFDVVLDTGFVIYDVYEIIRDPRSSTNWLALLADGGAAVIPIATGAGAAVRIGANAGKTAKAGKAAKAAKAAAQATAKVADVKVVNTISSSFGKFPGLVRAAKQLSPNSIKEAETMLLKYAAGNTSQGLPIKSFEKGIFYLRSRNGTRVFLRKTNVKDKIIHEIVGIADKSNESAVMNLIRKNYLK